MFSLSKTTQHWRTIVLSTGNNKQCYTIIIFFILKGEKFLCDSCYPAPAPPPQPAVLQQQPSSTPPPPPPPPPPSNAPNPTLTTVGGATPITTG